MPDDPFTRELLSQLVAGRTKEVGEGNGLGLMVAKGIASDHGGNIEVTNAEGGGTEFRVLFPIPAPIEASESCPRNR